MAIVPDKSGNSILGTGVDIDTHKVKRTNAGDPNGSVTPNYIGETLFDTTNKKMYQARSTANNTWAEIHTEY